MGGAGSIAAPPSWASSAEVDRSAGEVVYTWSTGDQLAPAEVDVELGQRDVIGVDTGLQLVINRQDVRVHVLGTPLDLGSAERLARSIMAAVTHWEAHCSGEGT